MRQFQKPALSGSGRVDSHGAIGANLSLSFSFGHDPVAGTWRMSGEKLAQRGEAAVSLYLDEDGDGHFSPGDKPLAGVGVNAGSLGTAAPTDKRGHAFVDGLQPYQKVLVSIDESALPDPFLVPTGEGEVITPRPGVPGVIALAVAPTGEVEGELDGAEGAPAPGVELELVAANGTVAARTRAEYDGYFVFEKVVYGTYRLAVALDSEKVVGLQGELARPVVLGAKAALVRIGAVRLRPATTLAAAK